MIAPPDPSSGGRIVAATPDGIAKAAAHLAGGDLVAFPTETVYGLGADASNDTAVAQVFAAKGRPQINPLIVHVATPAAADGIAEFTDTARQLAEAFWPGALTLVLPRRAESGLSLLVSAGLDTVAVRVPDHASAQDLLVQAGCPVAAPSANRSGAISPTQAAHVDSSLPAAEDGGPVMIVDAGSCTVGLESTVLDLSGGRPSLLRPGGVAVEDIQAVIGDLDLSQPDAERPKSPGLMGRHYAPETPLKLNAAAAEPGDAYLGFGNDAPRGALNLSPSGDATEAAANLFAYLRRLDTERPAAIAVAPIPETGIGRAINDRLRRAAQPRGPEPQTP